MNANEMGSFFENMGMMIKAGITPSEAVGLLKEESEDAGKSNADYEAMARKMSEGSSLEDAMKSSQAFPDYAVDMVGASEYTGKLEGTLFHLSDYYRTEHSMRNTFVSAVRYPIILLFMVIAVLIAMLAIVFPAFYGVYNNLTGNLAASSLNYINISFTLCKVLMVIMIILVILLLIGVFMWRGGKAAAVRNTVARIRLKTLFSIPPITRFRTFFNFRSFRGQFFSHSLGAPTCPFLLSAA